ncbi:hypothetical protein BJX76DRAFT_354603 [Aspergillus varians]
MGTLSVPPLGEVESKLKQAWVQLRYEQPPLVITVEGSTKVYNVLDGGDLQAWLAETFVVSSAADADELYRTLGSIVQATMYYLPQASQLVLHVYHYVIDAIEVLMLWDRYLRAFASCSKRPNIRVSIEPAFLAPSFADLLGGHCSPSREQAEEIIATWMEYANKAAPRGLVQVSNAKHMPAGQCRSTRIIFPAQATTASIQVCKARDISVTSAVHVAFILTFLKVADPNLQSTHYMTSLNFDLRPCLPKPYTTSRYAASVYYTPLPFNMEPLDSFLETARIINQSYRTTFRDDSQFV